MLTMILIIPVILVFFYYVAIRPLYFWKNQGVKQAAILEVFTTNIFYGIFQRDVSGFIQSFYNRFPGARYCGHYFFYAKSLILRDPELIKQMLIKDFEHFTDHRPFVLEECDPLFGKNLFSVKGPQWRHLRPILSPSFTSSRMKAMFTLMSDCAEHFVQHFMHEDQNLVTIEMKDAFTRFANDVIATTAFGVEVDSLENPENEFYRLGNKTTDMKKLSKQFRFVANAISPYLCKLLKIKFFEDDVGTFFGNLIIDTMRERKEKGIVRPDMIQLLMEAKESGEVYERSIVEGGDTEATTIGKDKHPIQLSDEDIVAQALLFFFAGFDSVSTMMCFMAHELAVNPDVQVKLACEVKDTMKKCQGKLTYDGLINMKYMDLVVLETLRKWPAQVGFERICTKPYTIEPVLPGEKPVHVEKGQGIIIPTFGIQRDPELFPDPERFDPERFSEENKANIDMNAFLVFGMGPRNCIGSRFAMLEIKVVFFHILSNFEIVPVEKTQIPIKLAKSMFQMGSEKGFWLGLKRLEK